MQYYLINGWLFKASKVGVALKYWANHFYRHGFAAGGGVVIKVQRLTKKEFIAAGGK